MGGGVCGPFHAAQQILNERQTGIYSCVAVLGQEDLAISRPAVLPCYSTKEGGRGRGGRQPLAPHSGLGQGLLGGPTLLLRVEDDPRGITLRFSAASSLLNQSG